MKNILLIITCLFFSACSKENTVVQKQTAANFINGLLKHNKNLKVQRL